MLRGESESLGEIMEAELFVHHWHAESFDEAIKIGCPLCLRLWATMGRPSTLCATTFHKPSRVNDSLSDLFEMSFHQIPEQSPDTLELMSIPGPIRMHLFPSNTNVSHSIKSELSSNTGSESALTFLEGKLAECQASHTQCCTGAAGKTYLPTRVIDVGERGHELIHLRNSSDIAGDSKYAALSHCWGGQQIITLNALSEASLRGGFTIQALPQTFQDAVVVCRRNNVRYLWIDSLCIFQDSEEDWSRESNCMQDVYSRGSFTIAATAAHDGREGLFFDRLNPRMGPVQIEITWRADEYPARLDTESKFLPEAGSYFFGDPTGFIQDIDQAPLNNRAWVVQERYLSPRIMHFSREVLYWECAECIANELYPNRFPDFMMGYESKNLVGLKNFSLLSKGSRPHEPQAALPGVVAHDPLSYIYTRWLRFRRLYTACKRTRDQDLLVALMGIASNVHDLFLEHGLGQTNDDDDHTLSASFIAGMWKHYLLIELCWSIVSIAEQLPDRPADWRAPTWSWASSNNVVQGSIYQEISGVIYDPEAFNFINDTEFDLRPGDMKIQLTAEILDTQVVNTLSGEVTSGHLRLKCSPFLVTVHLSTDGRFGAFESTGFRHGDVEGTFSRVGKIVFDCVLHQEKVSALSIVLVDTVVRNEESHLVEGILVKLSDQKDGAYERIGHFSGGEQDEYTPAHWILEQHKAAEVQEITII
ncbi:hypothetical protein E8E13_011266 [Curvularia kusanoi]|uniref:Heterokaryon incompatibility domain-containing protein n=1 Tax=Curvularia kusanoi TaxID=90978 RepID=A0A9P4WDY8_CURKU|nr:hypothetical protein E8E13_011266 [Curvularia kusanoi]